MLRLQVLVFALLSGVASFGQVRYLDHKVEESDFVVGMVNAGQESMGSPLRIISHEVSRRVNQGTGRTVSIYGRFLLRCADGSTAETQIVTSLVPVFVTRVDRELLISKGLVPVRSVEQGMISIGLAGVQGQIADARRVMSWVIASCDAKDFPEYSKIGYNLAMSMWVNPAGERWYGTMRVPPERILELR